MIKKNVQIWTDGSCSDQDQIGGWAAILKYEDNIKEISGNTMNATCVSIEVLAVIKALKVLKEPCCVDLFTDNTFIITNIEKKFKKYVAKSWPNESHKNKYNDILIQLFKAIGAHDVKCHWVKSHSGVSENERCDKIANLARFNLQYQLIGSHICTDEA